MYEDKVSILEQTLNERVLLAKQLETIIRTADHVTAGLSGLRPSPDADADSDDDE